MTEQTYKQKSSAIRAAKRALETAPEGATFEIGGEEGAYTFELVMNTPVEPTPAHDPAATMSEVDTISAPLVLASQGPVDDVAQEAVVIEVLEENKALVRPYGDLPEDATELANALTTLATADEDAEGLHQIIEDAGVPFSELRTMTLETAVAYLVKIISDDRAAWDHDFGGKKAPRTRRDPNNLMQTIQVSEKTHASTVEKPCKLVWDIAERMFAANPDTKRKDVLKAAEEAGVAFYTARTQYQQWLAATKASAKK